VEQVCEAVAYAHRHLIVHRDLKPSNLLVTADGRSSCSTSASPSCWPTTRGADAASDGAASDGVGALTGTGVRLLTPDYAAPEQLRGELVTTATDVYALGVVLYELLTGRRPHAARPGAPARGLPFGGFAGTASSGGDRLPPPPSTAVARTGTGPPAAVVAATRGATPERLRRQLAGDLDVVTLRALDPDPERRYPSAAALLDDLRRHRTGFPVHARPDGRVYRARAFVRRNRWSVTAAAGLFALLAGTAAVTTVQQRRTARALAQATAEATKARQVTQFVTALIGAADPYQTGSPRAALARQAADGLIALGGERLEQELAQQPAVRAELLHALGVVARNLGRYEQADTLLRRGLAAHRQLPAAPTTAADGAVAGILHDLGVLRNLQSDLLAADTLLGQALAIRAGLPGDHRAEVDATRYALATVYRLQARYAEAERLLRQVIADRQRTAGPALADAVEQLGSTRYDVRDYAAAEALARQAIAIREPALGADHLAVAGAYQRLGKALNATGRAAEAERAVRHALAIQRRRLPAGHPDVLSTESDLTWVLIMKHEYAEAERLQRRVLDARRRLTGEYSRDVAGSYFTLGSVLHGRRDLAGAAGALARAAVSYTHAFGPAHPMVRHALEKQAVVETQRGREAAALEVMTRVRRTWPEPSWHAPAAAPDPPPRDAQLLHALVTVLREYDDCRHEGPLARRALAAYIRRHPAAAPGDARLVQLRASVAACPRPSPEPGRR
jgi:serine/threonine-protein kinase